MTDLSSSFIYASITLVIFSLPAQFGQHRVYSACAKPWLWSSLAPGGRIAARGTLDEEWVNMAWKLLFALVVMLILATIVLAVYGENFVPEQQRIEQVLPDERFPD
jgi:hypothetical protein